MNQEKENSKLNKDKKSLKLKNMKKDLKHEREMTALELNACRIAYEESTATKFDLGKNMQLVLPFNESEVDKYFQHFEREAQNLK